jgi:hypothetical protein
MCSNGGGIIINLLFGSIFGNCQRSGAHLHSPRQQARTGLYNFPIKSPICRAQSTARPSYLLAPIFQENAKILVSELDDAA